MISAHKELQKKPPLAVSLGGLIISEIDAGWRLDYGRQLEES